MRAASLILATVVIASPSLACAPAAGDGRFVRVDAEDALIIWDGPAQREHFIRRALFDTDASDFGFLVPTPEKPELAEADDALFSRLTEIASPAADNAKAAAAKASAVTVLEQKVVAGLDAAVLEATDANALFAWLKDHGYRADPDLLDWTRPYVERGWKITAFKIAAGAPKVATKAVRMSFQSERPFFPYREPASQRSSGTNGHPRLLRVYFLADARFDGLIGGKDAWPGRAVFSRRIDDERRLELLKLAHLPIMAGGGGRWLTRFDDHASPRPGTDEVYFTRAADQSSVMAAPEPPSQSTAGITKGAILFLLAAGVGYSVWRFLKRSHG